MPCVEWVQNACVMARLARASFARLFLSASACLRCLRAFSFDAAADCAFVTTALFLSSAALRFF